MWGARGRVVSLMLFLGAARYAPAAIHFENFASIQELSLLGDARVFGQALRLTRARYNKSGAAWYREKQPVASGFDTTFQFQVTQPGGMGHGADGFAFVLQNSGPDALGGRGSAGGFAVEDPVYRHRGKAIAWSIAVFFDTYQNDEEDDPSDNYVSFCTYGGSGQKRWPAPRLALTPHLPFQLKDQKLHSARILFQPPVLSVFLDGASTPVLEARVDLSIVVDSHGSAWVGFTASTGGGRENHDILNWSFTSADVSSSVSVVSSDITFLRSACLPDRNLCTPERTFVEQNATGYHIILPANLEWGASVPNPSGRAVVVTNAHGMACWDLAAHGSEGCSGPSGKGPAAGPGFLQEDTPAGALVRRTNNDRTWFSVNGHRAGFKGNEGFYEFDLEFTERLETETRP